jgi:hypothetical protein
MKWIMLVLSIGLCSAQEPKPDEKELIQQLIQLVQKQSQQIDRQSQQIENLRGQVDELRIQTDPPKHRKLVTVLLRTLTVIDHTGSVASIYSVVPR